LEPAPSQSHAGTTKTTRNYQTNHGLDIDSRNEHRSIILQIQKLQEEIKRLQDQQYQLDRTVRETADTVVEHFKKYLYNPLNTQWWKEQMQTIVRTKLHEKKVPSVMDFRNWLEQDLELAAKGVSWTRFWASGHSYILDHATNVRGHWAADIKKVYQIDYHGATSLNRFQIRLIAEKAMKEEQVTQSDIEFTEQIIEETVTKRKAKRSRTSIHAVDIQQAFTEDQREQEEATVIDFG